MAWTDRYGYALGVVVLALGCGPQRIEITLHLPPGARGNVESGTVRAFDSQATACQEFDQWGSRFCAAGCETTQRPALADELVRLELVPDAAGDFGRPELELGSGSAWQVLVELTAAGLSLYGCATVTAGENASIAMLHPACEGDAACANNFHPACEVMLDCDVDFEPADPACEVTGDSSVESLEQGGRLCNPGLIPRDGIPEGTRCRPAMVDCVRGMREPTVDGICPQLLEEPCAAEVALGYDPEQDYDCNHSHPSCLEGCNPRVDVAPIECGSARCRGQAFCLPEGMWSDCTYADNETCDGVDNDCDDSVDEPEGDDPNLDCQGDEQCRGGSCVCGAGPACTAGLACCDGACVNLLNNDQHCGGCRMPCDRGDICQGRGCVTPDAGPPLALDGGISPVDAGPPSDAGPPPECFGDGDCMGASDTCVQGRCVCGTSGSACGPPEPWCCSGVCANLRTSQLHCERCDRPCRTCNAGRCFD